MKERTVLFLAQHLVKGRGIVFSHVLGHILYFASEGSLSELDFNDVSEFQLIGGFYDFSVYHNVAVGAGVVGNGASFDDARNF